MSSYNIMPSLKALPERLKPYLDIFILLALGFGAASGFVVVELQQHAYILIALVGLMAFLLAVLSVEFGLVMLVFLAYTRFSDIAVHNHGAPSVAKLFIVLLIVAIMLRWAIYHERPDGWQKPSLLIAAYGLVGFGSLIYAPETSRVIDQLIIYAKDAVIAIVVVVLLTNKPAFKRTIWTLLLIGIFLGSLSVWQYLTKTYQNDYWGFATANIQNILGESNDYRIAGPIGDPNYYAQIMAVLVPIALERVLHEKNRWLRLLAVWALGVTTFSVVLTYSRGGFLAMAVAILALVFFYRPRVYHIPVVIFAFLGFTLIAPPNYIDRIFSLQEFFSTPGNLRTQDMALRGRASENLAAYEMMASNPLFGIGLNNYDYLFNQYSKQAGLAVVSTERAAHNLYLEVAAETGIVGIITFVTIILVAMSTILRARKRFMRAGEKDMAGLITGFGAGFLAYMVASIFIHAAYPRYFYLLIGIALALELVSRTIPVQIRTYAAPSATMLREKEA